MPATLALTPLTATIGAEMRGVDLASDLSDEMIAEVRAALLEWKVVFFRDQHELDRDAHVAFGRRFGDLEVHPLTPKDQEQPEIFVIPAGGTMKAPGTWHSDVTWRPEPSLGSILRAVELPPVGGDTLWADMHAAYDLLDDATKERIDGLVAFHDYARAFGFGQTARGPGEDARQAPDRRAPGRPHAPRDREARRSTSTSRSRAASRGWTTPSRSRCSAGSSTRPGSRTSSAGSGGSRAASRSGTTARPSTSSATTSCPRQRIMERVTVVGDRPF